MLVIYGTFNKKRIPATPLIFSDEDLQDPRTPIVELAEVARRGRLLPEDGDEDLVLVWEYDMELFYAIVP